MASGQPSGGDRSNGWEEVAARFTAVRSSVGVATVRTWAGALSPGAAVLDLGCGNGVPIAEALMADGFDVHGIDASPSLVEAFRRRFPDAQVRCEAVEDSDFFGRNYDGIVAVGLLFLLDPDAQRALIGRVACALNPRGRFLFTAPTQAVAWPDLLTGRPSVSLGDAAYRQALSDAGLTMVREHADEGGNHYYDAARS